MPKSSPVEYALNIMDVLDNIVSSSENDIIPLDLSYIVSSINKLRKGKMKTRKGSVRKSLGKLIGRRVGSYILRCVSDIYLLQKAGPYGPYASLGDRYNLEFPGLKISFEGDSGTVKMEAEIETKNDKQLIFLSKEWTKFAQHLQKELKEREE